MVDDVDEALEETFPASDPPANTVETGIGVNGESTEGTATTVGQTEATVTVRTERTVTELREITAAELRETTE